MMLFGISRQMQKERRGFNKPQEIGISKYKEMLMATVKDALEILDYGSAENRVRDLWHNTETKEEKGLALASRHYRTKRKSYKKGKKVRIYDKMSSKYDKHFPIP